MTTTQVVTNLNAHAVPVRIDTPNGTEFVHLQPKATVGLEAGCTVNQNWLATATKIKVKTTEEDN